jgi:hypothetical protein
MRLWTRGGRWKFWRFKRFRESTQRGIGLPGRGACDDPFFRPACRRGYDGPVPYNVLEFQETPNPHAVKCIVEPPVPARDGGLRSYQSAGDAAGDPLAARLMGVPGVAGVFINQGWVTVTRQPGEEWLGIKSAVRRVFAEAE